MHLTLLIFSLLGHLEIFEAASGDHSVAGAPQNADGAAIPNAGVMAGNPSLGERERQRNIVEACVNSIDSAKTYVEQLYRFLARYNTKNNEIVKVQNRVFAESNGNMTNLRNTVTVPNSMSRIDYVKGPNGEIINCDAATGLPLFEMIMDAVNGFGLQECPGLYCNNLQVAKQECKDSITAALEELGEAFEGVWDCSIDPLHQSTYDWAHERINELQIKNERSSQITRYSDPSKTKLGMPIRCDLEIAKGVIDAINVAFDEAVNNGLYGGMVATGTKE